MSNSSTRHLKVSPVTVATSKLRSLGVSRASNFRYSEISFPAFSESSITWRSYSQLLRQYNFTVGRSFTLRSILPTPEASFLACIRFRLGNKITRYKLWSGVGEILPSASLYTNEIIKKNFTIEVWNVAGQSNPSSSGWSLILGIRHDPIDCKDVSNFQESAPVLCSVDGDTTINLGTSVNGQWDFASCEQHLDNV